MARLKFFFNYFPVVIHSKLQDVGSDWAIGSRQIFLFSSPAQRRPAPKMVTWVSWLLSQYEGTFPSEGSDVVFSRRKPSPSQRVTSSPILRPSFGFIFLVRSVRERVLFFFLTRQHFIVSELQAEKFLIAERNSRGSLSHGARTNARAPHRQPANVPMNNAESESLCVTPTVSFLEY